MVKTMLPAKIAKVKVLAESEAPNSHGADTIEKEVLDRIQNCLRKAQHPNTPEAEAQTALRMSARLMERYNVSQADLIAAEVENDESSGRAGQSTVSITKCEPVPKNITAAWLNRVSTMLLENAVEDWGWVPPLNPGVDDPHVRVRQILVDAINIYHPSDKMPDRNMVTSATEYFHIIQYLGQIGYEKAVRRVVQAMKDAEPTRSVRHELWMDKVLSAIKIFFDCKAYTTSRSQSLEFTFYGIAVNTVAAAMAFEMAFNLTENWAIQVQGDKGSYRLGIGSGLTRIANQEKKEELRRAEEQAALELKARTEAEERQRQEEISRLEGPDEESEVKTENEDVKVKIEYGIADDYDDDVLDYTEDADADFVKHDPEADHGPKLEQQEGMQDESDPEFAGGIDLGLSDSEDTDLVGNAGFPLSTFDETVEQPLNLGADLDEELHRHMPEPRKGLEAVSTGLNQTSADSPATNTVEQSAQRDLDKKSGMLWRDAGAVTLYRKNAIKIAEDFLTSSGKKLNKGRKRTARARDDKAFKQGQEDSKKIDVKRRRIEG